jgi:hypothetical protein
VTLAQIRGVQMHRRQRFGYKPDRLAALDAFLVESEAPVDRVVCHVDDRDELWQLVTLLAESALTSIRTVDVLVEVGLQGLSADAWLAAEAMLALAPFEDVRIHLDTLVELDRTMDVRGGLLNRMCNPRPSFRVIQVLNSVLHGQVVAGEIAGASRTGFGVEAATRAGDSLLLIIPGLDPAGRIELDRRLTDFGSSEIARYELGNAWVSRVPADRAVFAPSDPTTPYVLLAERG